MSWSSSFPPQRRSRSRSPRGSYPPAGFQQEYRDYDNYDRDKYPYDRDSRQPYEYGRRRSPVYDDSRKRRRSTSPYDRDRYEPRPRYNDDFDTHSRSHGHSPPRRGYASSRRAPPDPRNFDYPASLKEYADWFRYHHPQEALEEDSADKAAEQEAGDGSKPRNGIRSRWEKYKKEFAASQLQIMFDHHRKSPWFAEKYDPAAELQNLRDRVRKEGWHGRLNTFLHDLELGKFDPQSTEVDHEPSSPVKDSANGDQILAEDRRPGDDELQFHVDGDDDAQEPNGKGSGEKHNSKDEEASVLPEGNQVMIRTIPPDIGRVKLEEACRSVPGFMYLALGDPLQKRNFYRAGWIRINDDADMPMVMAELTDKKIDGFKLHVSHSTKPFVNKVRFTPEAASRPDRLTQDLANVKALAVLLEDEAAKLRALKVEDSPYIPSGDEDEEIPERGSDAVERRAEKIMSDLREQGTVDLNDENAYEIKKVTVTLDLYIAYIRAAYHTCFYCCVVTDHLEELQRKCIKHVRKPLLQPSSMETEKAGDDREPPEDLSTDKDPKKDPKENRDYKRNDEKWLEWFDLKIALLINRAGVDPRDYGGKNYDEELGKAVQPHIKQEDEGKFRCKTCLKLFKATSFVEKHIVNKHPDLITILDELNYFNNFALDPHRIQPFSRPPPITGNTSSHAPPQAFGIQAPPPDRYDPRSGSYYPSNGYYNDYSRRDEATTARRLSDRLANETSTLPPGVGLPPKPVAALDAPLGNSSHRRGRAGTQGGPPPPPPDAKEDPRAAAGKRVSYHDMDLVAEGDVELFY